MRQKASFHRLPGIPAPAGVPHKLPNSLPGDVPPVGYLLKRKTLPAQGKHFLPAGLGFQVPYQVQRISQAGVCHKT